MATFLNGLITPRLFYDLGATIAGAINTAFHAANSFAINFDWSNLGASLASSITGFFENWDAGLTGETFSNFFSGIFDAMTSFLEKLSSDDTFKAIGQQLVNLLCGIDWEKCIWNLAAFFSAFNNALLDFPTDFVEGIGEAIVEHITGSKFSEEARKKFEEKFAPIKKAYKFLLEGINPFTRIKRDIEFAVNAFEELKKKFSIGDWYNNNVKPWFTKDKWATVGDGIKSGLGGIGDWMGETFGSARKSVNDNFSDVGTWFGDRNKDIQNGMDIAKRRTKMILSLTFITSSVRPVLTK